MNFYHLNTVGGTITKRVRYLDGPNLFGWKVVWKKIYEIRTTSIFYEFNPAGFDIWPAL